MTLSKRNRQRSFFKLFSFVISILAFITNGTSQGIFASQQDLQHYQDTLEMWEEPRHQLVFSKDDIKVMDIRVPPGDTTEFHLHRYPTIYVVINRVIMSQQDFGEEWTPPSTVASPGIDVSSPGQIIDLSQQYITQNTYHRVANLDSSTFHFIGILSTRDSKEITDDPDMVLENEWFAAYRLELNAHSSSQQFTFDSPTLLIQYTKGESHILEHKIRHSHKTEAGSFSWHESNTPFVVENSDNKSIGFVVVAAK